MLIEKNEWDILKIYLARSKQGTINNLEAAYHYFKTKNQGDIFLKLLRYLEMMNESEFSVFADQIFSFNASDSLDSDE